MNISRPDSSSSQLPRNSTEICMRSHYLAYIKPPLNPSKKEKSESEMRMENQATDQTNVEKRNRPMYSRVTRRKSSKITTKP
jgi:hypothetical protein